MAELGTIQRARPRAPRLLVAVIGCVAALLSSVVLPTPAAAQSDPTTNGLFWGDGDHDRYILYSTSALGSDLYYYITSDWRLHVALVVSRDVNDNVFAPSSNRPYTQSAGWASPRPANRLIDSEYAEFTLSCGANSWLWRQGYAGQPDSPNNFTNPTWFSDHTVSGGGGSPPPGIASGSSFAWNLNNYATNPTPAWDMGVIGTAIGDWKSPFDTSDPNNVIGLDGYPATGDITFSTVYQYEWPMVYEWSVQLDPACIGEAVVVITGLSHHSPGKGGDEDDPFPPPPNNGELLDFGDLPDIYGDASHTLIVAGPHLGANPPDAEAGSQYSVDAEGDDSSGTDDEDGIVFLTPLTPGGTAEVQVTVTGAGFLSGFIDFDGDGVLEAVTYIAIDGSPSVGTIGDLSLASGTYVFTIDVPSDTTGFAYSRWRYTAAAGEGGNSPTGTAPSGEVEDYRLTASFGDFVWHDLNADGIQDIGEPGLDGVTVNLWQDTDGDGSYETFVGSTITAGGGLYSFEGLPGGSYQATVDPTTVPVNFVPTTPNPLTFVLAPGEENLDIDFGFVDAEVVGTWMWLAPFGVGVALLLGRGRVQGRLRGRRVLSEGGLS